MNLAPKDLIAAVERHFDPLHGWKLSDEWRCILIDYEHPHVFRLWKQVGDRRLMLHRLDPIPANATALEHPHPWPSANLIMRGGYEMDVELPGLKLDRLKLEAGSFYTMTDPLARHVVRPLIPTWSIMIVGQPYTNPQPFPKPAQAGEKIPLDDPRVRRFVSEWLVVWVDVEEKKIP